MLKFAVVHNFNVCFDRRLLLILFFSTCSFKKKKKNLSSPVCHLMATAIASLSIQPLHYQQHVHVLHITLCTTSTVLDCLTVGETKQKNMYTATEISRSRFGLQKEYGGKGKLGIAYCEADTTISDVKRKGMRGLQASNHLSLHERKRSRNAQVRRGVRKINVTIAVDKPSRQHSPAFTHRGRQHSPAFTHWSPSLYTLCNASLGFTVH